MENPLLNWRQKYGYTDTPQILGMQTPEQQAYWSLNKANAQNQMAGINRMPFVMNPGDLSLERGPNQSLMFQQPQQAAQPAQQPQQQPTDVLPQILALLQQNPDIVPLLLQKIGQPQ